MKSSLQSLHTFQHMLRVAKNQSNTKIIKRPKPKQEESQQSITEIPQPDKVDEQPIIEETKLITKSEPKPEPKPEPKSESKPKSENKLPRI